MNPQDLAQAIVSGVGQALAAHQQQNMLVLQQFSQQMQASQHQLAQAVLQAQSPTETAEEEFPPPPSDGRERTLRDVGGVATASCKGSPGSGTPVIVRPVAASTAVGA